MCIVILPQKHVGELETLVVRNFEYLLYKDGAQSK